jgi:hypothetical protein
MHFARTTVVAFLIPTLLISAGACGDGTMRSTTAPAGVVDGSTAGAATDVDFGSWQPARYGIRRTGRMGSTSGTDNSAPTDGRVTAAAREPDAIVTYFMMVAPGDELEARVQSDDFDKRVLLRRNVLAHDRADEALMGVAVAIPGGAVRWSFSSYAEERVTAYLDRGDGRGPRVLLDRRPFEGPDVDCIGSVTCLVDADCESGESCSGSGHGKRCAACVSEQFICGLGCGTDTCTYDFAGQSAGQPLCGVTAGPACTLGAEYHVSWCDQAGAERDVYTLSPPRALEIRRVGASEPDSGAGVRSCSRALGCEARDDPNADDLHVLLDSAEVRAAFTEGMRYGDRAVLCVTRGDGAHLELGLGEHGDPVGSTWLRALRDNLYELLGSVSPNGSSECGG